MTERIAISLDAPLLRAIERERKRLRLSRSEFMRFTTKAYFDAIERKRRDEAYERAYREMPETPEELRSLNAMAAHAASLFDDDKW
jgi:metal-responsive CopG/Arc/MetJ family transcriptional regulator